MYCSNQPDKTSEKKTLMSKGQWTNAWFWMIAA
jgi:hypothetical protein